MTLPICVRKLQFAHCTARLRIYTGLSVSYTFQVLKYRLCFETLVQRTLGGEREGYGLVECNAVYFGKLHGVAKQKVIIISVHERQRCN